MDRGTGITQRIVAAGERLTGYGAPAHAAARPPWCLRLTSELDAADARAVALAKDLTIAQLNWKPRPDVWSVGQCLEHLCISNEVYIDPMTESLGCRPAGPVDEITPGWFGSWFIRTYIEPRTQRRRARAPRKIVPVARQIDSSILDRFIVSNAAVRDVIGRAQQHDVNRVRFRNPFVPLIRFTVGTGLQVIARHNHRHLLQAERVIEMSGFPRD
jgi:DinB family protein